jgi:hypothetical protein
MPFTMSFPAIDIVSSSSLDKTADDGEAYAGLIAGSYIVKEVDTGGSGKLIRERPGTNRAVPWDWYVDKIGRSKII